MSSAGEWRVAISGQQQGPYSTEQVRQMIVSGQMPRDAMVWKASMSNWTPWPQVEEFRSLASSAAPGPSGPGPIYPGASSRPGNRSGGGFNDFITFRTMITPVVIQVLFWIGVTLTVLGGLGFMVASLSNGSAVGALLGLLYLVLGPLFWRVYCEIIIIFFRVYETLLQIRDKLGKD